MPVRTDQLGTGQGAAWSQCDIQKGNGINMLTGKQKSYLRSLAQMERPLFQIGKESITENLIHTVDAALRKRELIKVSVLKNAPDDIKEAAFDLARLTGSELVQVIGRNIVLYRRSKEHRIILP